jgi:hypothetical protein
LSATNTPTTSETPQFSLRALLVAVAVIALCVGLASASSTYLKRRAALKEAELARLAELDKATLIAIVRDAEAIRAKLGRAPMDQEELVSLLGRPMPVIHDGAYPTPISYHRSGENSFLLQYSLLATDDWIYDSNKPTAGWVQHWY